jgi:hypothetical protein
MKTKQRLDAASLALVITLGMATVGIILALGSCSSPAGPGSNGGGEQIDPNDLDGDGIPNADDLWPDDADHPVSANDWDEDGIDNDHDLWPKDPAQPSNADDWDEDGEPNATDYDPLNPSIQNPPPVPIANIGQFHFNERIMDFNFTNERFPEGGTMTIANLPDKNDLAPGVDTTNGMKRVYYKWYKWLSALQTAGNNVIKGYNDVLAVYPDSELGGIPSEIKAAIDSTSSNINSVTYADNFYSFAGSDADDIGSAVSPAFEKYLKAYRAASYYKQLVRDTVERDGDARDQLVSALSALSSDTELPELGPTAEYSNLHWIMPYLEGKLSALIDDAMGVSDLVNEPGTGDPDYDGMRNKEHITQLNQHLIKYIGDIEEYRACVKDLEFLHYDTELHNTTVGSAESFSAMRTSGYMEGLRIDTPAYDYSNNLWASTQSTGTPRLAGINANFNPVLLRGREQDILKHQESHISNLPPPWQSNSLLCHWFFRGQPSGRSSTERG